MDQDSKKDKCEAGLTMHCQCRRCTARRIAVRKGRVPHGTPKDNELEIVKNRAYRLQAILDAESMNPFKDDIH
jgi:hypothetical protein